MGLKTHGSRRNWEIRFHYFFMAFISISWPQNWRLLHFFTFQSSVKNNFGENLKFHDFSMIHDFSRPGMQTSNSVTFHDLSMTVWTLKPVHPLNMSRFSRPVGGWIKYEYQYKSRLLVSSPFGILKYEEKPGKAQENHLLRERKSPLRVQRGW